MSAGTDQLRVVYDDQQLIHNHSAWSFVPWHSLAGVTNRSITKKAKYRWQRGVPTLGPTREELEETSRRFDTKYLLAIMNSTVARDYLRANRRSNLHLYPDDWKQLPVPDIPPAEQAHIVEAVDHILDSCHEADATAHEAALDDLVKELYVRA
ncbi:MAG: hypothetical protein OXF41_15075 [bacterium]|nr:hypothetical protein [bacterium]